MAQPGLEATRTLVGASNENGTRSENGRQHMRSVVARRHQL